MKKKKRLQDLWCENMHASQHIVIWQGRRISLSHLTEDGFWCGCSLKSVTGCGLRHSHTQLMSPAFHCMAYFKYVFKRTVLCGSCLQREVLLNLSPLRAQNLFATACQYPEHEGEETNEEIGRHTGKNSGQTPVIDR